MGSGLGDEPPLEAPDSSAQAAMPAEAVGTPPQRMDEDCYREMQFHYNASLQQGYSTSETEDWLRQGYPALMEGFLPWYQVPSLLSTHRPQRCALAQGNRTRDRYRAEISDNYRHSQGGRAATILLRREGAFSES